MDLTGEQRTIIEADASDLTVAAGAGSGKTRVLVERYLRLLRDCSIPEIAAITFTEAAAAEMRERVRSAVMLDPALEQHRALLDEAAIGTVHSLGLRLLREHPVEAVLDPSAAVLADDEAELLRRTACIEAIDAAAEADDERTTALRGIGVYHAGVRLPRMVAERDAVESAFAAMGADSAGWPGRVRATLDGRYGPRQRSIQEQTPTIAARIRRDADAVSDRLAEVVRDVLAPLTEACEADSWQDFAALLGDAAARIRLNVGRRSPPDSDVKDALRELRELAGEAGRLPAWNEHDEPALEALAGLRALFENAVRRYTAAKEAQGALDYLDLELGAVGLLRDHPAVAAAVRERFRHLMVDESQDINPVQAELIELIAGGDGDGPRPALFLVGDARQSIYRFRGADVHRFTALQGLVARRGGPLLPLSRSFRSHDALVARINELFGEVFAGTAPSLAALPPMTGRPGEAPDDGTYLTLTQIGSRAPDGGRPREPERRRVEADVVAEEIERLLAGGRLVWDRDERVMRPAQRGDIAILLRRFRHVHVFQQALDTHGITAATPSGTGFFTRQEVFDCINLLRWLAEPQDDLALSGVLRSPFFALGDDTLLALRERGRPVAALADPPDEIAGEERARCAHASETLSELRRAAASLPADALLELALERTAVEASWAPLAGGEQARANIRKLLRIVRTLAGHPLSEVVSYLEQRRDDLDPREGPATLDRPDAVQLMTVHGAKGLEFPIVFVPEAHLSSWSTWDAVRWSREDGVSVTLERDEDDDKRPRPGFYAHLQQQDQLEDAEEQRRLFYVAATRAGDYLHISGDETGGGGWLHSVRDAHASGALREIGLREPVPPDLEAIARRRAPSALERPDTSEEEDYISPLLARPPAIPLRASTPVTALRPPETAPRQHEHGDGLAALRGLLVHRALEVSGGAPGSLDDDALADLAREQSERALDDATARALAGEAREMLDRFTRSPVAAALAAPDVERWFELPFAWDWDGVPVHGSIDLVYHDASGWHVIDFKSDRLDGTSAKEAARHYAVQIGLYQRAIEAAVGAPANAGLLFLRSGELAWPGHTEVEAALADARRRVDAGGLLEPADAGFLEEPE